MRRQPTRRRRLLIDRSRRLQRERRHTDHIPRNADARAGNADQVKRPDFCAAFILAAPQG
jgi:hypothetical protein